MSVAPTRSALAVARETACDHPQAKVPCPLCGAALRGENLEKHLTKTHRGGAGADEPLDPVTWSGPSRRVPILAFGALLIAAAWVVATRSRVVLVTPQIEAGIVTVFLLVFCVVLLLAETNRLRARLRFEDGTFTSQLPLSHVTLAERVALLTRVERWCAYRRIEACFARPTRFERGYAGGPGDSPRVRSETIRAAARLADRAISEASRYRPARRSRRSGVWSAVLGALKPYPGRES